MKILITGGTGFIGKNLVPYLLDKNYHITLLVRESSDISGIDKRAKVYIYNEDIKGMISFFKKEKFWGIIHLATHFVVSHTLQDIPKMVSSNIRLGMEILEAASRAKLNWFLNVGTFTQNHNCDSYNPTNLYSATKEALQTIAKYYIETSDLIFTTIKLNNTYGPNDPRKKLINLLNKIAISGESVDFPKGEQQLDFCYIDDVLHAFKVLISHLESKNCATFKSKTLAIEAQKRVSLKELIAIYEKVSNKKLHINWGTVPYRKREVMVPRSGGEIVPGWKPKYSLEEGFKKMITLNKLQKHA